MKKIAKEDLVKDVLDVYSKNNNKISRDLYINNGKYSRKPIDRIFGSWNNMLIELNIELNQYVGGDGFTYTEDQLINDLVRVYNEFGNCCSKLIKDECIACLEVYQRRFGSINNALKKAGLPTRNSGESIIEKVVLEKIASILDCEYEYQKTFNWLINPATGRKLYLDGYFPKYNLAVEYNGRQHYEVTQFIHNDCYQNLDIRKKRDIIKYKLLKDNNVNLLIVRYDENISNIHLVKKLANIV